MPIGCGLGARGRERGQEPCRGLFVTAAGLPSEAWSGVSGGRLSPVGFGVTASQWVLTEFA